MESPANLVATTAARGSSSATFSSRPNSSSPATVGTASPPSLAVSKRSRSSTNFVGIAIRARFVKSIAFEVAHEAPQQRLVNIRQGRAQRRHILVSQRARLVEQGRQFFSRSFALFRTDAHIEAPVASAIRPALAFDIKRDDAPAAVKGDAIDEGNKRRLNLVAADTNQFFLDTLGVVNAFDAHLIVDAKNDHATAGVGQRNYFLSDLFRIRKFDFELEKGVFAAAHEAQQFSSRSLGRGRGKDVFLEGTFSAGFVPLVAAKSSASHLCIDGALS